MSEATAVAAENGCPFCSMVMHVVYGGEGIEQIGASGVYHFEPLNPVTPGHRLFIPAFHYEDAAEAPSATGAVFEWASYWASEQGGDFNLIVNAGPAASQTVRHLHIHYVPRHPDDGLLLPWSAQHGAVSEIERAAAVRALEEAADEIESRRNVPGLVYLDVRYAGYYTGIRSGMESDSKALRARAAEIREGKSA